MPVSFNVTLSSPPAGGVVGGSAGVGTIYPGNLGPTVSSVSSVSGNEGTSLVHTVTLSAATTASTNYAYSLGGGTSTSVSDYTVPPTFSAGVTLSGGTLTVPSGVSSFTVSVAAISDGSSESSETYNLTIGGVTGVGTIGDVTGSPITPSISASRTTGTAPLAVFFDASGTTAPTLTSLPFHELLYWWDFGDGTGTFWSYGTKAGTADKNYAYGPEAAHVFLTGGSKTVTLTVIHISSGGTITTASTTQGITVTAESTTFPDSANYYIDSVAAVTPGSGGVPAASTGIQTGDMNTATAARSTAGHIFYLKRGGTYNFGASLAVQKQNIRIRAYGSGAAPIITFTAYDSGFVLYDGANDASDFQWHDCKFDGVTTNSTGGQTYKNAIQCQTSLGGSLKNVLVMNNEATTCGGLFASSACDGAFFFGNNLHDLTGGGGDVGCYHQYGSRLAIIGNAVVDCLNIEHNIRIQGNERVVIGHNTIRQAGTPGKQNITIRGYSNQASGGNIATWSGVWTEKIVISDNEIDGGSTGTGQSVQFAPQNTGAYERIRDIIFERNYSHGNIDNPIGSEAESNVTIRNNIILSEQASGGNGVVFIYAGNTVGVLAPTSHFIYNNSVYKPSNPTVQFSFIEMQGGGSSGLPSGIQVANNLVYAPGATQDIFTGSSSYQFALRSGITSSAYTATTNSSNAQIPATSSGWTLPPTTLAQWKPTSGYGINGGTYMPGVYEDFFNVQRSGTMDMGAVNP